MNGGAEALAPPIGRAEFSARLGEAVRAGHPFAAGKIGNAEFAYLQHPLVRAGETPRRRRAFEVSLAVRASDSGIWPTDGDALARFTDRFVAAVRELDAIGVRVENGRVTADLLAEHGAPGAPMDYVDQEPPTGPDPDCWLEHLRGRRVLLVTPFAGLLAERATPETYEAVWASTGKRWFAPAAVEALEFGYGFEPETRRRHGSVLGLLEHITERADVIPHDVAIVAAGGLGIPIAAHERRRGRVAVSLGGPLQLVFGVLGDRWRDRRSFVRRCVTPAWIDVPARYVPDRSLTTEDYW